MNPEKESEKNSLDDVLELARRVHHLGRRTENEYGLDLSEVRELYEESERLEKILKGMSPNEREEVYKSMPEDFRKYYLEKRGIN